MESTNLQLLSGLQNLLEGIERVFHSNWVSFSKAEVVIRSHQDPKRIIGIITTVTSYFSCSTKQVANFLYPTGTFGSSSMPSFLNSFLESNFKTRWKSSWNTAQQERTATCRAVFCLRPWFTHGSACFAQWLWAQWLAWDGGLFGKRICAGMEARGTRVKSY